MTIDKYIYQKHYLLPAWSIPTHVKAYCTTRNHGLSQHPYHQFNLAYHVNDDPAAVYENQQLLIQELGLLQSPQWLTQTHSHSCVQLTTNQHSSYQADACYTQESQVVCAIMTADCVPILLCNQKGSEVAAIHAGWRGLLAGVIEETISCLCSQPTELIAWIGPAIGPNHFEVDEMIYKKFFLKNVHFKTAFYQTLTKRWFANLFLLSEVILQQCGINIIYCDYLCTYSYPQYFYSYRRDNGITGRMASLIWIDPV